LSCLRTYVSILYCCNCWYNYECIFVIVPCGTLIWIKILYCIAFKRLSTGVDPGFQVIGGGFAHLKKIAPSGGRRENCWVISCEKSRFYAKKIIFVPILRGEGASGAPPPSHGSAHLSYDRLHNTWLNHLIGYLVFKKCLILLSVSILDIALRWRRFLKDNVHLIWVYSKLCDSFDFYITWRLHLWFSFTGLYIIYKPDAGIDRLIAPPP
jgi:hypothetical protein